MDPRGTPVSVPGMAGQAGFSNDGALASTTKHEHSWLPQRWLCEGYGSCLVHNATLFHPGNQPWLPRLACPLRRA